MSKETNKKRIKEALKDVNKRMKDAAKYEDIWPSEFIVIKHLKSEIRKWKSGKKEEWKNWSFH